jgi:hypothetical protein
MDFSLPIEMDDFFNFFADAGSGEIKILKKIESLEIKVIPLPKELKPTDFSEAIG